MLNTIIFLLEIFFLFLATRFSLKRGEDFLAALICLQAVFANLFVLKQISLFGLEVTAADSFSIGTVISLGVFQEFYGKEKAKKISMISLYSLVFTLIISQLHLFLTPSIHDTMQPSYIKIFGTSPRICIASLLAFFLSQRADIAIFAFLKNRLIKAPLAIRSGISTACAQLLDTLLFTFLGLYGIVHHLFDVFIFSLCIKVISILLFSSLLAFYRKNLRSFYRGA
jgi:queuosine precursor transporter